MPYANEIESFLLQSGGTPPPLEIRVWEGHNVIVPVDRLQWQDAVVETVSVPYRTNVSFSVGSGPAAAVTPLYSIGYSIHLGSAPGPLFRSGYFETLPPPKPADPNGFVSIIEAKMETIDQARLNAAVFAPPPAGLGTPPFPVPGDTSSTVTALAVTIISGALRVDVAGTTTRVLGIPVGFTYSVDLQIIPAVSMHPDTSAVVDVLSTGPGNLNFTGTGTPPSAAVALFLNVMKGFIEGPLRVSLVRSVGDAANNAAISSAVQVLGGSPPPTSLPPGVALSASRITIGSLGGVMGIHVVPAVGCFGSLRERLFPGVTTTPTRCPISALLIPVSLAAAPSLELFRAFRDTVLLTRPEWARYVRQYYRHGPEVWSILQREPALKVAALDVLQTLQTALRTSRPLRPELAPELPWLIEGLARRGSAPLRRDLDGFLRLLLSQPGSNAPMARIFRR